MGKKNCLHSFVQIIPQVVSAFVSLSGRELYPFNRKISRKNLLSAIHNTAIVKGLVRRKISGKQYMLNCCKVQRQSK